MGKLEREARIVITRRKELLSIAKCLEKIFDVFNASDIDLIIWKVTLKKVPQTKDVKCYVSFTNYAGETYYNLDELLSKNDFKVNPSHPIIEAMRQVNSIVDENVLGSVMGYFLDKPCWLECFDIEINVEDSSFSIIMNENAISKKQEPEE